MTDNALPQGVENFVRDHVPSINHLEALIRLIRSSGDSRPMADLAGEMRVEEGAVRTVAADLARSGLVEVTDDSCRFQPTSPELAEEGRALADAYGRFPVQLIRVIYERPKTPVQSFADAFRLRKE